MLPEILRLGLEKPLGVDEGEVADVGLLRGDQLGEDDELGLRLEHDRGRVDLHLLPGVDLENSVIFCSDSISNTEL